MIITKYTFYLVVNVYLLEDSLIKCNLCPRLREYAKSILPPPRFKNWVYWAKPVPGFGDPKARILIVGLAPAAHGGNRTGRSFTGDQSGQWIVKGLYQLGLANKPESVSRDDGLELKCVYITNAVKCVPPQNKPTAEEIRNCVLNWLINEIEMLRDLKVIVALGRVAFYGLSLLFNIKEKFEHGKEIRVGNYVILLSYHVSAQNTRTGRLSWEEWIRILSRAKELANC